MKSTKEEEVRKVLNKAIRFLHGGKTWTRGALHKLGYKDGERTDLYCILGAINRASREHPGAGRQAKDVVTKTINRNRPYEISIPDFNDNHAKNGKEVIAVLRKAARSLLRKITPKKKQKESHYFFSSKKQKGKAYIGG
jgi:hypothetical protein